MILLDTLEEQVMQSLQSGRLVDCLGLQAYLSVISGCQLVASHVHAFWTTGCGSKGRLEMWASMSCERRPARSLQSLQPCCFCADSTSSGWQQSLHASSQT